jgi:HK97 family phage prohead protease
MEPQAEARTVELKDADIKGRHFRGYAAVFDTPWSDALTVEKGYREEIARGAFRKALAHVNSGAYNVPLTREHDDKQLLATTRAGTLRLKEDGRGLLVEADLPNTNLGNDTAELIRTGDLNGMSYGVLSHPEDSRVVRRGDTYHRVINGVKKLIDTTLTWNPSWDPAVVGATVELRSAGFVALTLQELTGGSEEQTSQAAGAESSSHVAIPAGRFSDLELKLMSEGGWTP